PISGDFVLRTADRRQKHEIAAGPLCGKMNKATRGAARKRKGMLGMEDVVIIGAGPCGLSAAAELQDRGFDPLLIEKENVANSIYLYPTNMQFFSTPELLEIAGVPFVTPNPKPYRHEALVYYRTVAERRNFRIRRYEKVTAVVRKENGFLIRSETKAGEQRETESRAVV